MTFVLEVLRHTPPWVLLLVAYIVWMGARGLRTRNLALARVWVTPIVFIVLGIGGALARHQPAAFAIPAWALGAMIGAVPGAFTSPRHIEYDRDARRVRFRGSVFPLLRNLVIFGAQYVLAAMAARGGTPGVALWAIGVSGVSTGYFLGWTAMFLTRLGRAPQAALAAA